MDYRTRMRNIREDRDLTQKQVGEIINKSQQGYNHIETGRAELKIGSLFHIGPFIISILLLFFNFVFFGIIILFAFTYFFISVLFF